ncbi:MAG: hypothetical protein V4585_03335 [Bacteroidota bacterium]|jgi:hypothetical protein
MDTLGKDLDDLVEYLGGLERDMRPKKVKPLKNYIIGYFEGIKHTEINAHLVIKEMERQDLIFLGLNGDVIYNF